MAEVFIVFKRYCTEEGQWDTIQKVYATRELADAAELNLTINNVEQGTTFYYVEQVEVVES